MTKAQRALGIWQFGCRRGPRHGCMNELRFQSADLNKAKKGTLNSFCILFSYTLGTHLYLECEQVSLK